MNNEECSTERERRCAAWRGGCFLVSNHGHGYTMTTLRPAWHAASRCTLTGSLDVVHNSANMQRLFGGGAVPEGGNDGEWDSPKDEPDAWDDDAEFDEWDGQQLYFQLPQPMPF